MPTYTQRQRGAFRLYGEGYGQRLRGTYGVQRTWSGRQRGVHRVRNDALDLYKIWLRAGSPCNPNLPVRDETASLPWSDVVPKPGSGTVDYHVLVRKQNAYGLESQNNNNWTFTLDDTGARVKRNPAAPYQVSITPTGLSVEVTARYAYLADGAEADQQANTWLIYATSDGSTPSVPGDFAYLETMQKSDGVAKLKTSIGPYNEGDTIKVLVLTGRTSDGADSDNTNVLTVTVSANSDAGEPVSHILIGDVLEQQQ